MISGIGITSENFWKNFSRVANKLAPINKSLLNERDIIQKKIDEWHKKNKGKSFDNKEYKEFLRSINYIVEDIGRVLYESLFSKDISGVLTSATLSVNNDFKFFFWHIFVPGQSCTVLFIRLIFWWKFFCKKHAYLFFTLNLFIFVGSGISSRSEIIIKSFSSQVFKPLLREFLWN